MASDLNRKRKERENMVNEKVERSFSGAAAVVVSSLCYCLQNDWQLRKKDFSPSFTSPQDFSTRSSCEPGSKM